MSVTDYMKWFEDHPGKMTDTYSQAGSSSADTIAYGKHELSGQTVEELRKFVSGESNSSGGTMANEDALYRGKVFEAPNVLMTLRYLCKFTDPENITSTYPVMEPDVYDALQMASSIDHKLYFHKPVHLPVPGVKDQFVTMQGEVINELKSQMIGNGELKRNYISQSNHQMVCTGGDFALVSVFSKSGQLTVYPIERDNEWIADYLKEVAEFWRRVEENDPYPEPIDNDYVADLNSLDESDILIDLLEKRQMFEAQRKEFDDDKKAIDEGIKQVLKRFDVSKGIIGPFKISLTTVERKPQPERVVPATPGSSYEKLTVTLNKENVQ